ncbi:hypothetical protein BSKO_04195 [Bryopsis sp. KO-2023]|nr:hypothetical protein BSKO_04195 [Bryopsis sp. KO-2023]
MSANVDANANQNDAKVANEACLSSAKELCTKYFNACKDGDLDLWISTLHTELKSTPSTKLPGPFKTCNWYEGRNRVNKYQVQYEFTREVSTGMRGADPTTTLAFQPKYGKVAGYEEGAPLGGEIQIILKMEDGKWKMLKGDF